MPLEASPPELPSFYTGDLMLNSRVHGIVIRLVLLADLCECWQSFVLPSVPAAPSSWRLIEEPNDFQDFSRIERSEFRYLWELDLALSPESFLGKVAKA